MGTFRKSLKLGKKSRQIEENLKKLDKELEKTGALNEDTKTSAAPLEEQHRKFDWRREFFPEKDQYEMVNLLYEERQQKLKEAIGEEKIRIAEEVESLREVVDKKRELRQLHKVDQHLANIDVEFYKLRDDLVENINEKMFPNIPAIEQKLDEIITVYDKLSTRISEGFLNEPSGSAQGGDPLAKTDFVTFDQLKQHYSLFLDRISTQLATLGGGGEVELKYLDDVVGIATNGSAYDGKYLKYNHTSKNFEFADVGPIGITTELQTLNNVLGLGNTSNLGMSVGVSTFSDSVTVGGANTALVVEGNVRIVGVLTVGSGSITIDGDNDTIGMGTHILSATKVALIDSLDGDTADFAGDVKVVGVLTALSIDSSNVSVAGSITGTTFYGDGSNLTGITGSVGVGTTTISTESITVSGIVTAGQFIRPDGTSSQFLKADGSVDSNTYLTSEAQSLNGVLALGNTSSLGMSVGVVTATGFVGDGSGLTGLVFTGGDIIFSGITTFNTNAIFADNRKAVFGTGSDLQIFHDGADSYISELGEGKLILNTNGPNIELKYNNSEFAAKFDQDAGAQLYYNNLNKLEIISTGATTYGTHYASSFSGDGASITGITTAQIVDFGNVVFGIGSSTNVTTTGSITAGIFYGDGSTLTGIATPGFVNAAVAGIVSSAPSTLDTLNELAQALGDDPNFATTTTNLIGTKASLAGAAFTGSVTVTNGYLSVGSTMLSGSRLYAKERLYIGDNEDIRLYQVETGTPVFQTDSYLDLGATNNTGSNGVIKHGNRGTYGGSLSITNNSDKKSAEFKSGWGGVELYYCVDGGSPNLRFSTTETGAGVVGILTADRMVGAATSNVIPFLYSTLGDLPSASTYHGAFAHVHATGGAYYAHSANWVRLVNYDIGEGNVSIGTADFITSGDISAGIVTAVSAELRNLRLGTFGSNNIFGVNGPLYLDSEFGQVDIVNNLNVNGISTLGRVLTQDIVGLSSATFTGIVTAQSFRGDGSQLTGVGATNLNSLLDVNAPTPSPGQVLKWSGSEWQAAADLTGAGGTGIGLSDLSVTTASVGVASLSYNNQSGVFNYTPPDFSSYLSSNITTNVSLGNGYVFTYDSSATARFGTLGSNDYGEIFWGTDSSATGFHVINKDFDGALYLTNTGTDGVYIRSTATELGASFKANAESSLYYNNALKFSTSGVGATVYGDLQVTSGANIAGVITAQEFKGTFTGVVNYATLAGVASTANYATESLTSGYASVAGIASGISGTPNITVGELTTTGAFVVGAGQTSSFGDRVTVRDDISVEGSTPTLRVQDSDSAESYAYLQYDASGDPTLKFRSRANANTPDFIWDSEASGGIDATTSLMYMKGGPRGNYDHGYVAFGSTVADERLHVGGSLKVTENINASGIITANIIRATQGIDAPLYITESVDDDAEYNMVMLNQPGGAGGNNYRVTMVDNGGITFNPFENRLTCNNMTANQFGFFGNGTNLTGIPTAIIAGNGISIGSSTGLVTISATATGINTADTLVTGGINALGVVTATQFVGDGSGLTGIVASGTGVVIQDEGGAIGTAGTINFAGTNVSSALSNGTATVTVGDAYAQVAGVATVAQGLTGSPNVTTANIECSRIGVGIPANNSYSLDISGDVRLFGGDLWMPYNSTGSMILQNKGYVRNLTSNSGVSLALQAFGMDGGVGIGTTNGQGGLFINSPTKVAGVVTATAFVGDGSLLTGIVASGTGITIQEEGSAVGTASTINFVGAAVTATISSGTATISISAPPPASGGKFVDNAAGIHTTSSVGINTVLPKTDLQVGSYGMQSGIGTFAAVVGTPVIVDQFNVSTLPFVTAEYTLHIQHANGIQSQKVLVMQDGSNSYSNEFAIMYSSADPIVSFASTVSGGACQLKITPLTGTTGITTYRFSRGTLL